MRERGPYMLLIVGAYIAGIGVATVPAALFLMDRSVPPFFAIPLGCMLANIALIAVLTLVRIYLAVRPSRKDQGSN